MNPQAMVQLISRMHDADVQRALQRRLMGKDAAAMNPREGASMRPGKPPKESYGG